MVRYILFLALATIVVSAIRIFLTYELVTTEIWKEANVEGIGLLNPNYFLAVFIGELYVVGFTMAIKLGIDYVKNISRTKELENKRLEAELLFLRSQVQPHFFFNTLNSLYSLTLTKSDKAPETILKLSDLMSYVIYKSKLKIVPLSEEIKHINDFIDLEKLRFGKRLHSSIELSGEIDGKYIPPLILLPFIENCFKHGNTSSAEFPVDIKIEVNNNTLNYIVTNKVNTEEIRDKTIENRKGVGVKNTIRQLDLIFKNHYSLEMTKDNGIFKATLIMPLYDKMPDS